VGECEATINEGNRLGRRTSSRICERERRVGPGKNQIVSGCHMPRLPWSHISETRLLPLILCYATQTVSVMFVNHKRDGRRR
jgi:hypothetical protein